MRTIKQYNVQRKLISRLSPELRTFGVNLINSGYVYAPYIPVQLEQVTLNNQLVGVSSRYASVQVNPNYYDVVQMPNVNGRIFV